MHSQDQNLAGRDQRLTSRNQYSYRYFTKRTLTVLKEKQTLWIKKLEDIKIAAFPTLNLLLEGKILNLSVIIGVIIKRLEKLNLEFCRYIS